MRPGHYLLSCLLNYITWVLKVAQGICWLRFLKITSGISGHIFTAGKQKGDKRGHIVVCKYLRSFFLISTPWIYSIVLRLCSRCVHDPRLLMCVGKTSSLVLHIYFQEVIFPHKFLKVRMDYIYMLGLKNHYWRHISVKFKCSIFVTLLIGIAVLHGISFCTFYYFLFCFHSRRWYNGCCL